ncbi:MAG: DUF3021 family protein [Enterococcus sp.]
MNKLIYFIRWVITGIGFGCFFQLLIPLLMEPTTEITRIEFGYVVVASGLIGSYSYFFKLEHLSYLIAFLLHFVATFVTIMLMGALIDQQAYFEHFLQFMLIFMSVYGGIWVVLRLFFLRDLHAINQKLKKTRT